MTERPIEEIKAGDAFVNSLVPRADSYRYNAPLWHGWALMDAFLAGIDYARADHIEIERLRAALKPIAEMGVARAEKLSEYNVPFYDCPEDFVLYHDNMGHPLTVGMVREAKRILEQ